MQLFYTQQITNEAAAFDEAETTHALQALRLKNGDEIHFTDGNGKLFKGLVELVGKKQFIANKIALIKEEKKTAHQVHLYVSPTKMADRMEWLVEKATELGVASVTPLLTERTFKKNTNTKRLKNLALSGMKQSLQVFLPIINEPTQLAKINFGIAESAFYFGYCGEGEKQAFGKIEFTASNIHLFIGPEGDFTAAEIDVLLQKKCIPVTLGETRLRTETAALYAIAVLKNKFEN
ncbi:MAG TPA: RsmE family RNA methyltransferase [Flavobacteriales bacterium]|nr:RsmE family RNA methyltransferase [Flavobacteriales bacterium]